MKKEDHESLVSRLPTGPLTERELQETRHSNLKIIDEMLDTRDLQAWGVKVDRLWACLGWIPLTASNWKALGVAMFIAVMIGGQSFVERISILIGTYFP